MIGINMVSVVVAFTRQQPFRTRLWRTSHWLIFTQLFFFPALVAVGVLFPAVTSWPNPKANVVGHRLLDALFYLSLGTSVFWLWRMKGLRWLSASLLVLQQIVLIGAGLVAGMSVSGEWL
jgi:VanZ family protein